MLALKTGRARARARNGYEINSVYAREQDESEALSSLVWALGACKGMMQSRSGAVQLKATIQHCRTRQGRNSLIHRYTLFLPSSLSLRPPAFFYRSIHFSVSPINSVFLFTSPAASLLFLFTSVSLLLSLSLSCPRQAAEQRHSSFSPPRHPRTKAKLGADAPRRSNTISRSTGPRAP